jgi:hypothetical protein
LSKGDRVLKNPTLGVALIIACLGAQWAFARYHLDPGNLVTTALGVGIAIALGREHVEVASKLEDTRAALDTLRASMRPGREPSQHDIEVPPSAKVPRS